MRFLWLDGLRGLLSGYVASRHYFQNESFLFAQGWLCVDLFFILSGFVLFPQFINAAHNGISARLTFIRLRILRIFPFLFIVICFRFAFGFLEYAKEVASGDIGNAHAFSSNFPIDYLLTISLLQWIYPVSVMLLVPLWSLSVEFYASILQLLVGFKFNRLYLVIAIVIGYLLITISEMTSYTSLDWRERSTWIFGFGRAILGFNLGLLLRDILNRNYGIKIIHLSVLFGFFVMFSAATWRYFQVIFFISCEFTFLVLVALLSKISVPVAKSLLEKVLIITGKTSFGVYLFHPMVISLFLVVQKQTNILGFIAIWFVSIVISYASLRLWVPSLRRSLDRLLSKWRL